MSKIPVDKRLQNRYKEAHGFNTGHAKLPDRNPVNEYAKDIRYSECDSTVYKDKLPKTKEGNDTANKNARIEVLRQKLNEITKHDGDVVKQTKGLINDITQSLVDEEDQEESGPYSLLFELRQNPSSSFVDMNTTKKRQECQTKLNDKKCHKEFDDDLNRIVEKLPSVIHFDDKPMKELEYSCEAGSATSTKNRCQSQARSDLFLNLKSSHYKPSDNFLSPTDAQTQSLDDSLGILTPDQMDDMCLLENMFSPTMENLPVFEESNDAKSSPENGESPSTERTESQSTVSTIQNEANENINNTIQNDATVPKLPEININDGEVNKRLSGDSEQMSETSNIHSLKECVLERKRTDKFDGDDDFMPSIHISILDPISSIAENAANLDLPLDSRVASSCLSPQRIEQTPSPEDLPLDSCDINCELSTCSNSQYSTSVLHDTQTFSDSKTDCPKSMETSKVSSSFITSITSMTSLDGYQGDGEMSRPISRAADHSIREEMVEMEWQNIPVPRRADPMTDSDFFTESDADGLDDHMHRGDRKAQVIDGALYGGKNGNGGNPALIVNNRNDDSCMESSGVYTDFENHRSSPVFLNVIEDMSPEGSTPSTHSEFSQKNVINQENLNQDDTTQNVTTDNEATPKNNTKRGSLNSEKSIKVIDKIKEEKRFTLKKYKMPKRDVPSKLKSMLTVRKLDSDASVQSSPKSVKKNDRRESFVKKNSLEKVDYKVKQYKDVKSKVDSSLSLQRSQTTCSVPRMLSTKSANNGTKAASRHMRMRKDPSYNGSGKSSLHSSQSDISASSAALGKPNNRFPLRNGKKRELASTPKEPRGPAVAPLQTQPQIKKNGVVQKLSASPVSLRSRSSTLPAPPASPRKPAQRRTPPQRQPSKEKEPPRVGTAVVPRGKRAQQPPIRAQAPIVPKLPALPSANQEQALALQHAAKGVEALGVLVQYLVFRLDALNGSSWRVDAERWRTVAAAEQSNAARADLERQQRAKKDYDTINECLSKISQLEMEVSMKEEANARLQTIHVEEITSLANDIKSLKDTIESLKHEVAESRARLHSHSEIEKSLRAQLEATRTVKSETSAESNKVEKREVCDKSCDISCETCDAACDPVDEDDIRLNSNENLSGDASELAAEIRSLRAVVELKQAEVASLRSAQSELELERERRTAAERDAMSARHAAEELRERADARQKDVDRLREDNRRLREVAARDRDHATRLSALNEELRYKLRQKSQVVTILAGNYTSRGSPHRTTSCSSPRSTSPSSPPSPASPEHASSPAPAVKAVVEKHDSVSWVLEIEETPEEEASRLARRSSFRATPPSGMKRRGGGSPPSASPAPASPAPNASKLFRPTELDFPPPTLKESAGEAIYIYDDHQC